MAKPDVPATVGTVARAAGGVNDSSSVAPGVLYMRASPWHNSGVMIRINANLSIDEDEIRFTFARSPGPGGQNVNKVATKATLHWDITNSPSVTEFQRSRLMQKLATRINAEGILQVVRSRHRTQSANREDALESFVELLAEALRQKKARKKTKPSRAAVERRLDAKGKRGELKRQRQRRFSRDEY